LLTEFGVDVNSSADHERVTAWANDVVAANDVAFLRLADSNMEVTFDPATDRLLVRDGDALELARLMPGEPSGSALATSAPAVPPARDLQMIAEAVHEQMDALFESPGMSHGPFNLTTREVGFASIEQPVPQSVVYEYLFSTSATLDEFEIPANELRVGVTRFGDLSSITVSDSYAQIIGHSQVERSADDALAALVADLSSHYPDAVNVEFIDMKLGYALAEEQSVSELDLSLLVSYVVVFEHDGGAIGAIGAIGAMGAIGSRRLMTRVSLVSDSPPESLMAADGHHGE
jgi:hypothetical protein